MSDSAASSPEPSSQAEVAYPSAAVAPPLPPPPPAFRSAAATNAAMQASYPGPVVSGMNYSERPYENQMLCQSNNYSSYQPPPSPYRPHPVSPPAHSVHQYGNQMHSNVPYTSGHQMSPYANSQSHYTGTAMAQDMYPSRPPSSMYPGTNTGTTGGGNNHLLQQMKSTSSWGAEGDMLQAYGHQSPRQPMLSSPSPMPPPPLRSPPHIGAGAGTPASAVASANHYRSQMVSSSPTHSPHSWPQQIPSPSSVLHSPRATPSPLPSRSPAHSQFSPPPSSTTPSPHHPPPAATPHQLVPPPPPAPPKSSPASPIESLNSPGSSVTASSQQQSSGSGVSTDPLQSLQKMVMLDSSASGSTEGGHQVIHSAGAYDMTSTTTHSHHTQQQQPQPHLHHQQQQPQQQQHHPMQSGRPSSYFSSVENLAGHDPGSPYPTYYNLDQNRLCTPPRTVGSTPTSSTFTSAPDSTSNSSVSGDSYPTLEQQQQQQQVSQLANGNCALSRPDCDQRNNLVDCSGLANGGNIHETSNSHEMMAGYNVSPCFMDDKKPKVNSGHPKSMSDNFGALVDADMEKDINDRMFLSPPLRKNMYPLSQDQDSVGMTNGQLDYQDERLQPMVRKRGGRGFGPRFSSPPPHWNRGLGEEDVANMAQEIACAGGDNGVYMSMATKRTPRKRRSSSCPIGTEMGPDGYFDPSSVGVTRSPRSRGRSPRPGRGRGRRRSGVVNPFVGDRPIDPGAYMDISRNSMDGMHHDSGMSAPPLLARDGWEEDLSVSMGGTDGLIRDDHSSLLPVPIMEVPRGSNNMVNMGLHADQQQAPYNLTNLNDCSQGLSGSQLSQDGSSSLGPPPMNDSGLPSTPHNSLNASQVMGSGSGSSEKKRGRPRGSKNKPKVPGEEKKPVKGKGKRKVEDDQTPLSAGTPMGRSSALRPRPFNGPYVRVEGTRDNPIKIEVVNVSTEEKDVKCTKGSQQKRPYSSPGPSSSHSVSMGGHIRKRLVHTSTLSPFYDAFTRDKTWVCSLCHKGSHYRNLGDLFGPYYSSSVNNDDHKPSGIVTPSSGVPTPLSITVELGAEGEQEPAVGSSVSQSSQVAGSTSSSASVARDSTPCSIKALRTKRKRSEPAEEYFKSTIVKRARQASHPSFIQGKKTMNQGDCSGTAPGPADLPAQSPATPSSSVEESTSGTEFWVHEDCAVWSHGVYLLRNGVRGLDDAIREAADMICCKCKLNGATIGCLTRGCGEQYHYVCATDRGCEMDEDNATMYCPKHRRKSQGERPEDSYGC